MRRIETWALGICALLTLITIAIAGGIASASDTPLTSQAMPAVTPTEFRGDVRDLPLVVAPPQPYRARPGTTAPGAVVGSGGTSAMPLAPLAAPLGPMPAPSQNFAGLSFADLCGGVQCGGGWPSISNGATGPNHYIQAVNFAYAIYSKTGTLLASFTENQLFAATGTAPCSGTNFGDAIVLYDQLANRFILSNLAFALDAGGFPISPFSQCIAVSKTGDPVSGGWWLYALRMDPGGAGMPPVGALNDYGKFGLWPDCLYLGTNEFQMPGGSFTGTFIGNVYASFSRNDLYRGSPLTWSMIYVPGGDKRFLPVPATMSGTQASNLPPTGRPAFFVAQGPSSFQVRTFTAGPNCGSGGTLSAPVNVSQAEVGGYTVPAGNIVPQPDTANVLDALDDRVMQKVQYRRVGGTESLWAVHNVQTTIGVDTTVKPHWAQIDVSGGVIGTTPVQQQIYAPDSTLNRWFGSLAVDNQGNMALGYSTANGVAPNYPSIAYAGRQVGDPLNNLPQSEVQLVAGAASQTNNCGGGPCHRWGDYSGMSIDPADDCTFWYTAQYYSSVANGASGNWQTRIGAFKFASCVAPPPGPAISASPSSIAAGASITATWGGISNPTHTDWIALYVPGAANNAYLAWIFVNCSQVATVGAAAGSCALTIPGTLASGTYELRLLANNSFTVLATSNSFTVTGSGPTLSASPGSVVAGGSVTATWSGIPSPTTTDWIGLYTPGAANTVYLAWIYVSCSKTAGAAAASGSCAFAIPGGLAPGTYQLRLLSNNGFTLLATSNNFTVTAAGPALSVAPTSVPAGGSVTATWSGIASPTTTDWIGLYAAGAPNNSYLAWIYVSCSKTPGAAAAAGSCAFTIPSGVTPGTYELRLLANNGFTVLAVSSALTVTTAGPGLSASPPTVMHGASVTATWSAIPSPTTTDWIGLYTSGAVDTAYIAWIYVSCSHTPGAAAASGACPFTIPSGVTPGAYELRLFTNNGFTRLATSNPLTVQ